jgi:glyoxylase-like metal-dependent hydrolase (beta-lactamase superfamily II)
MTSIIYRDPNITIFQSVLYQTNSTVVETEDVILVFDPAFLPDEVLEIRRYVDSIRRGRPVFLFFTHSDFDHIIGYRAFEADKVFMTEAMAKNQDKEKILNQITAFDDQYYIRRPYPIEYPEGNFLVYKDGAQFRHGHTKMAFYLTPGHTADSMMIIVWQLGLCIAGDYLSDIEFPFIDHSSVAYEQTLHKLPVIHDRNWFTRMVPGHGRPSLALNDWLKRRTESLAYIYALRESIVTGIPFDESSLWSRYPFPGYQRTCHEANLALMKKEYSEGLWDWDPVLSANDLEDTPPVKDSQTDPSTSFDDLDDQ